VEKISNSLLVKITEVSASNPSYSLKDCCLKLDRKPATLYSWYRNLRSQKWGAGYSKTSDNLPLQSDVIDKFLDCFEFSSNAPKILKRLLTDKCLKNRHCYAKQFKVLKNAFSKYPSVSFWMYAKLGDKKDEFLFYLGKNELDLKQKYIDFHAQDDYIKFEYDHKPSKKEPKKKKKRNLWDYYES